MGRAMLSKTFIQFSVEGRGCVPALLFDLRPNMKKVRMVMVNTKIRLTILFAAKDREALYSQQKMRPGADCGSDDELLIAKFRLKLKKVGKAIRLFRYDLNQRPYNYTVEMTNRFKELHLIDTVPEELWTEVGDMIQEGGIKNILKKKKYKK